MDVLVTGATGFVGANTARLLVAEGYRVRVLARTSSSLRALEGCPVEVVRGDILDAGSVARAIKGCAQVFHVAADYRLWAKDPGEIYRNNVDGTRTVLDACAQAGVGRVVYTSSVGTIGLPRDGGLGTEATPVGFREMIGPSAVECAGMARDPNARQHPRSPRRRHHRCVRRPDGRGGAPLSSPAG